MKDAAPQTVRSDPVRLADYKAPNWLVEDVHLTFRLDPTATRVISRIRFRPNPDSADRSFRLDGEDLKLLSATIDGRAVEPRIDAEGLSVDAPNDAFTWECEVEIDPKANTRLEGLYMSKGMYCTQCEAEGFRRITFYPDRPDVMAPFTVRIESDEPVMLSNGNPTASGEGWAEWHDPWPKPAYLFALVAGDLRATSTTHRTSEGREATLNVWVRPGDEDRTHYALDALRRSMEWDEKVYGRAYDLDVFNLVAVDDFNMGAMENKGLNIFNSKYVLASPETATDRDFEMIEGIVAHEYFHNWTGNRITCRDWFQLCLKEGLTVFRDQQFSGDVRGHAVKRIDDVLMLRARQFREDAGPLAHPVRPAEYVEINNFYTATVYEKGAEVIGMLRTLVGPEDYDRALTLYFDRHDGDAATIEDFFACFQEVTGNALTGFERWWSQAGTPRVTASTHLSGDRLTLTLRQSTPATPGQPIKAPVWIPLATGVLSVEGEEIASTQVLTLKTTEATWTLEDGVWHSSGGPAADAMPASEEPAPILSINRGFSAPVILDRKVTDAERLILLAHDTDPFNRWEAGRQVAKEQLLRVLDGAAPDPAWFDALERLLSDDTLDPAFRALALGLPAEDDIAQSLYEAGRTPDPARIHAAREEVTQALAVAKSDLFRSLFDGLADPGPYSPDAGPAGRRALRLRALDMLSRTDGGSSAAKVFASADNMTESLSSLAILIRRGRGEAESETFFTRWHDDPNTLDKWFSTVIGNAVPDEAVAVARRLTALPEFDPKTPNRFRAAVGALTANTAAFHHVSGEGYRFLADWLIVLDPINPQTAARMTTAFETWRRYDGDRQGMMTDQLRRILATDPSRDVTEIVTRLLGDAA